MDATHSANTPPVLTSVFPLNTDSPVLYRLTVHRIGEEALSKGALSHRGLLGKDYRDGRQALGVTTAMGSQEH